MTFFSRPNLEDLQFKQLISSELTLSGQTRIATVSGLTLATNNIGGNIIITAEGATGSTAYGQVLTYDGVSGKIKLMPSAASGDTMYNPPYKSPASITLGGISGGTTITGRTISSILEELLVPTVNPTLTAPSSTFIISPLTTVVEVGSVLRITGCTTFNRGCINPQYTSACSQRSGLPKSYDYIAFGVTCSPITPSPAGSLCNSIIFSAYTATTGNNIISATVEYYSGATPKNSAGGTYLSGLTSGSTTPILRTISGIYPYFYGKVTCSAPAGVGRPTATAIMVTGGTKCVLASTGTICINFNTAINDYIWFGVPSSSTIKTCWYTSALNNGSIGGAVSAGGNLFPAHTVVTNVKTTYWSGQTYNVYVSNYQTAINTIMELRNI